MQLKIPSGPCGADGVWFYPLSLDSGASPSAKRTTAPRNGIICTTNLAYANRATNDHLLIENLTAREPEVLFGILNALGDQSADYVRTKAEEALPGCQQLLIATHVPPFPQAALYQEKPSGPEFAPHFVNVAMGSVLLDLAQGQPDKKLTVLAGHTHHAAYYSPRPNLVVKVADGRYGHPAIAEVLTL